jgi:methionyl-tRNA formyltransferase
MNDPREVQRMVELEPDVVLVFGCGILKDPVLRPFDGRIINIHLGLSPYYRGSGTNFWPLVNREPEYVGATIHYIDAGIDTGPIIGHVRPEIRGSDGPHDIGNRAITAAADLLVGVGLAHAEGGGLLAMPQMGGGQLHMRKDFSADAVRTLRKNFEEGMIEAYLTNKAERDATLDLVQVDLGR